MYQSLADLTFYASRITPNKLPLSPPSLFLFFRSIANAWLGRLLTYLPFFLDVFAFPCLACKFWLERRYFVRSFLFIFSLFAITFLVLAPLFCYVRYTVVVTASCVSRTSNSHSSKSIDNQLAIVSNVEWIQAYSVCPAWTLVTSYTNILIFDPCNILLRHGLYSFD